MKRVFCTVLVAILQVLMHRFKIGADSYNAYRVSFTVNEDDAFRDAWRQQLEAWDAHTTESSVQQRGDGLLTYDLTLRTTKTLLLEDMMDFFKVKTNAKNVNVSDLH